MATSKITADGRRGQSSDVISAELTGDPIGWHYKLGAYICGKGCIRPSHFTELVSFTRIFQERPGKCRYAVAQLAPLYPEHSSDPNTPIFRAGDPAGPWVVWDLLDEQLVAGKRNGPAGYVMPPPPLWMGDTEDGMVMKAMALYDQP